MEAEIYFNKWGVSFFCQECGSYLDPQKVTGELIHRSKKGFLVKRDDDCRYAGKRFRHPLRTMKLQELQ